MNISLLKRKFSLMLMIFFVIMTTHCGSQNDSSSKSAIDGRLLGTWMGPRQFAILSGHSVEMQEVWIFSESSMTHKSVCSVKGESWSAESTSSVRTENNQLHIHEDKETTVAADSVPIFCKSSISHGVMSYRFDSNNALVLVTRDRFITMTKSAK